MVRARVLLGRDEWVEAAIDELAVRGIRGLAVEPLARRLRISKGSFYWHFKNLNDLVSVVLKTWRSQAFEQVTERLGQIPEPRLRLASLIHIAWNNRRHLLAEAALVTAAQAGHRQISRALEQVTRQRLDYLRELYEALGFSSAEAQRWALTAYSAFVGTLLLLKTGVLSSEKAVRAHAKHLEKVLLPQLVLA